MIIDIPVALVGLIAWRSDGIVFFCRPSTTSPTLIGNIFGFCDNVLYRWHSCAVQEPVIHLIVGVSIMRRHRSDRWSGLFALGLMGIIGLDSGLGTRSKAKSRRSKTSQRRRSDQSTHDDRARKRMMPTAPAKSRPTDLPTESGPFDARRRRRSSSCGSMGSGSAVCVSADGFFVTNHHVVAGAGLGPKCPARRAPRPEQPAQCSTRGSSSSTKRMTWRS